MAGNPPVSAVVRTFNRPERLGECLRALLAQKYRPFEIVVVNDGGESVERVLEDEGCGEETRYVANRMNLGRTAALNVGVEAARGEYVNIVDDDDWVYPRHLATLAAAAAPERLPVVYSDVLNVEFALDSVTGEWIRKSERLVYSFDFEPDNFLLANYIPVTCLLIRRDCFEAVGPFDESLPVYEDWEFLIRLSRKYSFKHVNTITGEYRRRDDNSNVLERDAYAAADPVVRRRYINDRDAVFDPIFKSVFQLRREIRNRAAQLEQVIGQAGTFQRQMAEMNARIQRLQWENERLRTGGGR